MEIIGQLIFHQIYLTLWGFFLRGINLSHENKLSSQPFTHTNKRLFPSFDQKIKIQKPYFFCSQILHQIFALINFFSFLHLFILPTLANFRALYIYCLYVYFGRTNRRQLWLMHLLRRKTKIIRHNKRI